MSLTQKIKQRTLSIIVILMMTMAMLPAMALASSPADITSHWAQAQIEEFMGKGLVNGYPDGTFKPDNNITRAEFMVMVNGAFGYSEKVSIDYKDVTAGAWYADAVAKAKAAGYIAGYADGTVKPDNPISRQEAAVIIMQAKKLGSQETSADKFTDAGNIPAWSKGGIGAVVAAGIMSGYPDGTFKSSHSISRSEAVVALSKALGSTAAASVTPATPVEGSKIYNKAGTYGPANGTETIKGNVTIKAKDVILQNTIIEGKLIIDKAVADGNATLKKAVVQGDTYIYGGGINSVHLIDTQTGKIYVIKDDGPVRIVASGTTEISQLIAQSSVRVQEVGLTGQGFEGITVDKKADGKIEINLVNANVDTVQVKSEGVTVNADKDTRIATLVADAKVAVTGTGTVAQAVINASGVTYDTKFTSQTVAPGVSAPTASTLSNSGGGGGGGGGSPSSPAAIATAAIAGVTAPVAGATPVSTIAATTEYTATISWSGSPVTFAAGTAYTATITITPKAGYTLTGVSANFFTVAGATATNTAGSGVVTAVFPATVNDVTSSQFTTSAVNNTVTITLTGGTFKAGAITAGDFTFTGTNAAALAAGTFTRTSDTVVTVTNLTLAASSDNTVLVKAATQAIPVTSVTAAAGTQLTITNPTLTLSKTYNGNTTAAVTAGSLIGVGGTDVVTVSATATYDTKTAGTNKTITVVYTLNGADAAKYIKPADYVINTGVITAISIGSLIFQNPTKTYDGNTNVSISMAFGELVAGDTATVTASGNYDTAAVGNKLFLATPVLSGADAGNYSLDSDQFDQSWYTGDITALQLTVTDPSVTLAKPHDGNTTAAVTAGSLIGVVGTEEVTVSAAATYDTSDIGTGKTITVVYTLGGAAAGNYIKPVDKVYNTGSITAAADQDLLDVQTALAGLSADAIKGTNAGLTTVYANLAAPGAVNGVTFDFNGSTNSAINGTTGAVTLPAYNPASSAVDYASGDVTLRGTKNGKTSTRVYSVDVLLTRTPAANGSAPNGSAAMTDSITDWQAGVDMSAVPLVLNDNHGVALNGLTIGTAGFNNWMIESYSLSNGASAAWNNTAKTLRITGTASTNDTVTMWTPDARSNIIRIVLTLTVNNQDLLDVQAALAGLSADAIKGSNASLTTVKTDLAVPAAVNGVTFDFVLSDNVSINWQTGVVNRPDYNPASSAGADDTIGNVTLRGTKNGQTSTRVYSGVIVLAKTPAANGTVTAAAPLATWQSGVALNNLTYTSALALNDDTGAVIYSLQIGTSGFTWTKSSENLSNGATAAWDAANLTLTITGTEIPVTGDTVTLQATDAAAHIIDVVVTLTVN